MADELTPLTRIENFLAGNPQELEPLTRIEWFLSNGGGGLKELTDVTIEPVQSTLTAELVGAWDAGPFYLVLVNFRNNTTSSIPAGGQLYRIRGITSSGPNYAGMSIHPVSGIRQVGMGDGYLQVNAGASISNIATFPILSIIYK